MSRDAGRSPLRRPDLQLAMKKLVRNGESNDDASELWPRELMPIDHRLASHPRLKSVVRMAAESRALRGAGPTSYPFRYWQVETLLDQAADILERAIRDRGIWDSLRSQLLRLKLEVGEFDALNDIHKDEVTAGWYTLEAEQSGPEAEAQRRLNVSTKAAAAEFKTLNDAAFTAANMDALASEAGLIAKATAYSSYAGQHQAGIHPQQPHPVNHVYVYDPGCETAGGETQLNEQTGDAGAGTPKGDFLKTHTTNQSKHSLAVEAANILGQTLQSQGAADAGDQTVLARSAKADWDLKNVDFQRRRSEAAVEINELKRGAMTTPGGAYNFGEQLAPVYNRFSRDFIDAYARLIAAQDGLARLYNYQTPLPPLPTDDAAYKSIFDDALVWTRDSVRFLAGFSQLEQSFSIPVSVRQAVGSEQWLGTIAGAVQEAVFAFDLKEDVFPAYRALRLRGLSVYTVSQQEAGPWRVTVVPPRKAVIRFVDDNTINHLDQTDVPPVVSGRVMTRLSQRDADTVGISSLRNVSPISDGDSLAADRSWIVKVQTPSLTNNKISSIDDLNLDLHVAARL